MDEHRKRQVAGWLLGIGLLCLLAGFAVYTSAKNDVDSANHINAIVGDRNESVDMMWPFILWGGGGLAVLCSVILFAGARDPEREEAPPPADRGGA